MLIALVKKSINLRPFGILKGYKDFTFLTWNHFLLHGLSENGMDRENYISEKFVSGEYKQYISLVSERNAYLMKILSQALLDFSRNYDPSDQNYVKLEQGDVCILSDSYY